MKNWTYGSIDRKTAQELVGFLPESVFDIHAHLYRLSDLDVPAPGPLTEGPAEATVGVWRRHLAKQVKPAHLKGGLFCPFPPFPSRRPGRLQAANEFVVAQAASDRSSKFLALISSRMPPEQVERFLGHPQMAGFKPYHFYSLTKPTFRAAVEDYLPEWAWKTADRRGLIIMLHLVRDLALADPGNQRQIVEMCSRYPGARLILAHAARGFHARNTINGLPALRGLGNVWFDTSGICEPGALRAILQEFGPRRLLWGSDFPVSQIRGKCVSVGDGFAWLMLDTVAWDKLSPACHPTLVGLESLRAVREAAEECSLNESDLQDIFCDNARRLLGLW